MLTFVRKSRGNFCRAEQWIVTVSFDTSIPKSGVGSVPPIKLGLFLSKYGVDLTRLAAENKLDRVIGRVL